MHILYIARWYPHKYDPMLGLFVKRHAEASALYCSISVIYVQQDDSNDIDLINYDLQIENGLTVLRVYYKKTSIFIEPFNKLINFYRYLLCNFKAYNILTKKIGKPDLIHVHILTRAALPALFLKIFYKIPYIITEHWSRYLPYVNTYKGWLRKIMTRLIVRKASAVTTVTENLKLAMLSCGLYNNNYIVIPNSVDTELFKPDYSYQTDNLNKNKIIIGNISCFEDKSKNISGILNVIKKLTEKRQDFELHLIGEGQDLKKLELIAQQSKLLNKYVFFKGLLEGEALVEEIQNFDFLLMFSNYENMPVVINECLACAVPVLSSDVGGISEIISTDKGLLVKPGDEEALLNALIYIMNNLNLFDKSKLREYAVSNFSKINIGKTLSELYKKTKLF
ncbi:MAG: glycosyltransferase [Bacteroidales bacterium]|nr:glycosyltransferase [Bacteroidales bacterium]